MFELLTNVAAGAVTLVGGYLIGSTVSDDDSEGCNGHHWEDKWPRENYKAHTSGSNVVLKEEWRQECEDCGKFRSHYVQVESLPVKAFKDQS